MRRSPERERLTTAERGVDDRIEENASTDPSRS
jgi:hypothetical protein